MGCVKCNLIYIVLLFGTLRKERKNKNTFVDLCVTTLFVTGNVGAQGGGGGGGGGGGIYNSW